MFPPRAAIRVFVPDREAFLDAAGLKSEARMSALEFERQRVMGMDLRSVLARGWRHLRHVQACFPMQVRQPSPIDAPANEVAAKMAVTGSTKITSRPPAVDPIRHHATRPMKPTQGMRMSL